MRKNLEKFIDLLKSDKIISLISDAGTPCVSDPGSVLVNEAIKENINIFSVYRDLAQLQPQFQ